MKKLFVLTLVLTTSIGYAARIGDCIKTEVPEIYSKVCKPYGIVEHYSSDTVEIDLAHNDGCCPSSVHFLMKFDRLKVMKAVDSKLCEDKTTCITFIR